MRYSLSAFTMALFLATASFAQTHDHGQAQLPGMSVPMDHGRMMHGGKPSLAPKEAGQEAFSAIQEIVEILEADPTTDWARVNIEALRQHLIDMNNVTLLAVVGSEPIGD